MHLSHPWIWYKNGEGGKVENSTDKFTEFARLYSKHGLGLLALPNTRTSVPCLCLQLRVQSLRWSFLKSVDSSKRSELEDFLATLEFRIEVLPNSEFSFKDLIDGGISFFLTPLWQVHREPIHHERHHVFSTREDQLQYGGWDAVSLWSKLAMEIFLVLFLSWHF